MTITEYEQMYTELAKYAMTIIADEMNKCKRFEGDTYCYNECRADRLL